MVWTGGVHKWSITAPPAFSLSHQGCVGPLASGEGLCIFDLSVLRFLVYTDSHDHVFRLVIELGLACIAILVQVDAVMLLST